MLSDAVLVGSYDYRLVALSLLISTLASYAALDLGGRVTASRGRLRFVWLIGGAVAMGMGIWSMHYIGMLAYSLPVTVFYDWPTVLLSLLAAIVSAAIALFVVSRNEMGPLSIGIGGLLMGIGIAAMHYIGMEAMRLPAMCHYSPGIVISVRRPRDCYFPGRAVADFPFAGRNQSLGWRKLASALLMGAAIPVMHYTGMAAVTFTPMEHARGPDSLGRNHIPRHRRHWRRHVEILILAILTSFVDRRFSAQSVELHLSEQRYRQLVESAQVILWRSDIDITEFSYVNQAGGRAARLSDYKLDEYAAPSGWIISIRTIARWCSPAVRRRRENGGPSSSNIG